MNEENQTDQVPMQEPVQQPVQEPVQQPMQNQMPPAAQAPQMPKAPADKSNFYWAIALLAMALFFAFGVLLTYLGLTKKFMFNEPLEKVQTNENMMYINETQESTAPADDSSKTPEVVTDELLEDLDELENTDVEGAYDERPLDEIK